MLWNDKRTPQGHVTDTNTGQTGPLQAHAAWGGKPIPADFHERSANQAAHTAGHRVGVAPRVAKPTWGKPVGML